MGWDVSVRVEVDEVLLREFNPQFPQSPEAVAAVDDLVLPGFRVVDQLNALLEAFLSMSPLNSSNSCGFMSGSKAAPVIDGAVMALRHADYASLRVMRSDSPGSGRSIS